MNRTEKDHAVYLLALSYRRYDDANPDVGMGWSDNYFVDHALTALNFTKDDVNYHSIITRMKETK